MTVQTHDTTGLRRVFGTFPTGVTAIAAFAGNVPLGIAASSYTSVSLTPPIVSVCIGRRSTTWPRIRRVPRIGISVLGEHQEEACRQLAARDVDRFASLPWQAAPSGAVFVEGSSAWLECSIYQEVPVGDHDVILLRVHAYDSDPDVAPLVFHGSRFRQLSRD